MLRLVLAAVFATASCAALWFLECRSAGDEDGDADGGRKRRYVRGMREREYLRLIPESEMLLLKPLMRRIYVARGWGAADAHEAPREDAWRRVLATATSPAGGSWPLDFQPNEVSAQQLQALLEAVEAEFLGGVLAARVAAARRPRLKATLGVDPRDPHSWLSGLHPDNTVFVNANRWHNAVTPEQPLLFEGALCGSKLEALAHTLGHELVHALVLNFFPSMEASSPAYTPDDRHGPIFMLLSKRLFGHVGHTARSVFGATGG